MSKKEKEVIKKLSESIKKLGPIQKEYFAGLADGMALVQKRQELESEHIQGLSYAELMR